MDRGVISRGAVPVCAVLGRRLRWLACASLAGIGALMQAQTVVLNGSFTGSTLDSGWAVGGTGFTPVLTASSAGGNIDSSGDGWLRLTSAGGNQATYAYDTTSFASTNATITASFSYVSYGGSGADGITFFLADASQTFAVGAYGGSLGYAQKTEAGGATDIAGMNGGYIGLGIDEFGNYANPTEGRVGGLGSTPDAISVRGPGDGLTGYDYLGGTGTLSTSLDTPSASTRSGATVSNYKIIITATNQLTVYADFGATGNYVALYSIDISGYARPEELIMGFTGSTGGSTNIHEVRNVMLSSVVANLWTNAAGDSLWGTDNSWYGNPSGMVPSNYSDILLDNTYVSTAQTIDVGTTRTIRSLQIDAPFGYTLNNGTLTFDKGGIDGPGGIYVSQTHGSADHAINSAIALNNAIEVQNNGAGSLALGGNVATNGYGVTFNGSGATTLSGVVSGTGSLTQSGTGTTTLSGANTYSGGTTISAGTLNANSSTALGTGSVNLNGGTLGSTNGSTTDRTIALNGSAGLSGITTDGTLTQTGGSYTLNMANATQGGAVNLSNNGTTRTLTVQVDSGTSTISGAIAGSATNSTLGSSLTKTGAGTLVLSGANTYAGTTRIEEGTVRLGANNVFSNSSAMNIAGGTLDLAGYSDKVGNLTFSGGATLDFGGATTNNSFVFGNVTPAPSGILTINNYVGPDSSNINDSGDFLGTTQTTALSSTIRAQIYFSGYGTGSYENTTTTDAGNGLGFAYRIVPVAINWSKYTWESNSSSSWNTKGNWSGNKVPPSGGSPSDVFVNFGTGSQSNVNYDTASTINALRFSSSAISYTISGSNTLTFENTGSITFVQQQSANNQTLSPGSIVIKDNMVFDITGAGNLTVGSAISDGISTFSLTKAGSGGKLILTQANTYGGGTSIQAGTVQVQNNRALGGTTTTLSSTTVFDGATLELTGGLTGLTTAISLSGNGVSSGGALKNVSGGNTVSGAVTLASDSRIQSDAGTVTLNGGISSTSAKNLTLAGAGDIVVNSAITTGAGSVTINGTGTSKVTYQGSTANTYTGDTVVNSGTLALSKTSAIAIAGNIVVNGGAVSQTKTGQIASSSTVTLNGGTYTLSDGTTSAITQTVKALNTASGSTVSLGSNDTLTVSGTGVSTVNGVISGDGKLVTAGTGSVYLGGANTYTGGTTIGGVVTAANSSSLGASSGGVTINSGGNLQVQGGITLANNFTVTGNGTAAQDGVFENVVGNNTISGSVTLAADSRVQSDSGILSVTGATALAGYDLNVGGAGNTTLSTVTGTSAASIVKDGSGTLTLSGSTANTYSGGLQINQGTVVLNKGAGTNAVGGGPITVGDGVGSAGSATLRWAANEQLSNTAGISINSDGAIDLNGRTETVGSVSGSGQIMIGTGQLIVGGDNSSMTFSGLLTGGDGGVFTKTGTGTLTFSSGALNAGTISYGGEFNLNGGTLALDDVNLTVDTLRLTGDAVIDFGGSSTLTVGTLIVELTGGQLVTITSWQEYLDYFYADSVQNGDGSEIPDFNVGGDAPLNHIVFAGWSGGDTKWHDWDNQISPVPEPAAFGALLVGGLVGMAGCRRRRREF